MESTVKAKLKKMKTPNPNCKHFLNGFVKFFGGCKDLDREHNEYEINVIKEMLREEANRGFKDQKYSMNELSGDIRIRKKVIKE